MYNMFVFFQQGFEPFYSAIAMAGGWGNCTVRFPGFCKVVVYHPTVPDLT